MKRMRSARWLLLALVITLIPISSQAGVFISVGFAPPVLPVYVQPPCPEPGLMWTPGYWAYGPDGYYWVPGAWVPAPFEGALWTPGYWGWENGLYVFHEGYWGRHVGYYGGVNYGFGYGGIGFAGGEWRGHDFHYNTVVVNVDRRYIHNTFEDRGRVERGFVARDNHVAFSGGPGGIHHAPGAEERIAEHEQHMARTSFQQQHDFSARGDRNAYARNNGGRPQNMAASRPIGAEQRQQPGNNMRGGNQFGSASRSNAQSQQFQQRGGQAQQQQQQRSAQPQQQQRGAQSQQQPQFQQRGGQAQQQRNAQPQQSQQRNAQPQQQRQPQQRNAAQPQQQHSAPANHPEGNDKHKH